MRYDAVVVGGNFAGLSAAMQLARARRRILLVDAGEPRNRFAQAAHGFLGQDGVPPAQIMREGLRQLSAYPTVDFHAGRCVAAGGELDGFALALDDGASVEARRLVLACGVADTLPALPGLAERWGRTVLHCPFCHGYEVADRPLGVLATGPLAAHQAQLVAGWGPTTLFMQGEVDPDAESAASLARSGVTIEPVPILELIGEAPGISAVRLADGRTQPISALFIAPQTRPAGGLVEQLGCQLEDGPTGPYVRTDERRATSVTGVFAAGDAVLPMHNATLASASGVIAGVGAFQSLIF